MSAPAPHEVLDERFHAAIDPGAPLEVLHTGTKWAEGPAWFAGAACLIFSDVPGDRMLRWDERTGAVETFRTPSNHANGNTIDREGRLVTCEHGGRRVTRTEPDGSITVLTDSYDGMLLNSPNDVVVHSDGSVWFTDPPYGIESDEEGHIAESEIGACHVYRWEPDGGSVRIVADDFVRPNGLAFSLDERVLYVSDSGGSHDPHGPRHIRAFDVGAGGELSGGEVFASSTNGNFDGFRLDADGRIWAAAGDGVHCLDPDGTLLGKLLLPETAANVCFGGPDRRRLLICATTSLYSVGLAVAGAAPVG
ncbi:MAG: SMP-30/gluconolactonase/LRE family protein [Acidimicrobiales bacterium]